MAKQQGLQIGQKKSQSKEILGMDDFNALLCLD
jgi:hypothetical protein